jgi:hypothetical protein
VYKVNDEASCPAWCVGRKGPTSGTTRVTMKASEVCFVDSDESVND